MYFLNLLLTFIIFLGDVEETLLEEMEPPALIDCEQLDLTQDDDQIIYIPVSGRKRQRNDYEYKLEHIKIAPFDLLPLFPLQKPENFQLFELECKTNPDVVSQLVSI